MSPRHAVGTRLIRPPLGVFTGRAGGSLIAHTQSDVTLTLGDRTGGVGLRSMGGPACVVRSGSSRDVLADDPQVAERVAKASLALAPGAVLDRNDDGRAALDHGVGDGVRVGDGDREQYG
jgi:hypothetical protein